MPGIELAGFYDIVEDAARGLCSDPAAKCSAV